MSERVVGLSTSSNGADGAVAVEMGAFSENGRTWLITGA